MGITVTIDETLAENARKVTGLADATAAIVQILRDVTEPKRTALQGMLDLAGINPLREDYDYKALRTGGHNDDRR